MLKDKACIISGTINPCGTPQDTLADWGNAFPGLTKNVLFMR